MNIRYCIVMFLLRISGNNILKNLSLIRRFDKYTAVESKYVQQIKLKNLLFHTFHNVPYYKKKFLDAKLFDKEGNLHFENFSKVDFLQKKNLQENFKELTSLKLSKKVYKNKTGGSTGEPTEFLQDKYYEDWNIANKIYLKERGGMKMCRSEIRLWGSPKDIEKSSNLKIKFKNFLYNRIDFDAFKLNDDRLYEFYNLLNNKKPCWIEAYVDCIYEFALFAKKNKLKLPKPLGIITSAGTLYPEMEKVISEVFHCKIYNRYGSREVGDMACSDNKTLNQMKISWWNNYIEVVDSKIYVTNLNNYSMPLIRYEIGDLGVINSKNRNYFKSVDGRDSSLVQTISGGNISGLFFQIVFGLKENGDIVKKFQVIQHSVLYLEVKLILLENTTNDQLEKFKRKASKKIEKEFTDKCKIKWNIVNEIPPLKSGKYLYLINKTKK